MTHKFETRYDLSDDCDCCGFETDASKHTYREIDDQRYDIMESCFCCFMLSRCNACRCSHPICSLFSLIFGLIIFAIFLAYVYMFIYNSFVVERDNIAGVETVKILVALNWISLGAGAFFSVCCVFFYFKDHFKNFRDKIKIRQQLIIFSNVVGVIFLVSWIVYAVLFFMSEDFHQILTIDREIGDLYDRDNFHLLIGQWMPYFPTAQFIASGKNSTHGCMAQIVETNATGSEPIRIITKKFNIQIFFMDFDFLLQWDSNANKMLSNFQENISKFFKEQTTIVPQIKRNDYIKTTVSSIVVTEDGVKPMGYNQKWNYIRGLFWGGHSIIQDIKKVKYFDYLYAIKNIVFAEQPLVLDINTKCWELYTDSDPKDEYHECPANSQAAKAVDQDSVFTPEGQAKLFQTRLSRAYYLSDCVFNGFQYIEIAKDKDDQFHNYSWSSSTQLYEEVYYNCSEDAWIKPPFYMLRYTNEIWVVVEGSDRLLQWATTEEHVTRDKASGEFHLGFYTAAMHIWSRLMTDAKLDERFTADKILIFTGYSYGGAVAAILHRIALRCYENRKNSIFSYTFGAPPSMSVETAEAIKASSFAFVNGIDPVIRITSKNCERIVDVLVALMTINQTTISSYYVKDVMSLYTNYTYLTGPTGTVYSLALNPLKKTRSMQLSSARQEKWKTPVYLPFIWQHRLANYQKNLFRYKDGLLFPSEFDSQIEKLQ